jgi:hypothetical protein
LSVSYFAIAALAAAEGLIFGGETRAGPREQPANERKQAAKNARPAIAKQRFIAGAPLAKRPWIVDRMSTY